MGQRIQQAAEQPRVCDRQRKRNPCCADLLHSVACGECGKAYTRCELHGGSKGANLSLHSHCALSGHRRYTAAQLREAFPR